MFVIFVLMVVKLCSHVMDMEYGVGYRYSRSVVGKWRCRPDHSLVWIHNCLFCTICFDGCIYIRISISIHSSIYIKYEVGYRDQWLVNQDAGVIIPGDNNSLAQLTINRSLQQLCITNVNMFFYLLLISNKLKKRCTFCIIWVQIP